MFYARGSVRTQKKAGRFPIRAREGPAKNPLLERQRNAQQDTETQQSLAGYSNSKSKKAFTKLGWFSRAFAETTD